MIAWTFPYPVGANVNHQYQGYGHSRRLSDAAFSWREEARLIVRQAGLPIPPPPYRLVVDVFPPPNRIARDLDGILKQTIDAVFTEIRRPDTINVLRAIVLHARRARDPACLIVALHHLSDSEAEEVL